MLELRETPATDERMGEPTMGGPADEESLRAR